MLQFAYKLKITEQVKAKCERHPRYNPEKDGRAGIRGGCSCCFSLYDLYQARMALDAAQREFIRRAAPWTRPRERRRAKTASEAEPSSEVPRVVDHSTSDLIHERLGLIWSDRVSPRHLWVVFVVAVVFPRTDQAAARAEMATIDQSDIRGSESSVRLSHPPWCLSRLATG